MYVLFETSDSSTHIYKSTDEGENWGELMQVSQNPNPNVQHMLAGQGWYNNVIVVSPTNESVVIAGGTYYAKSTDAGLHWQGLASSDLHVDVHQLRFNGSTLWICNDGGIWSSPDEGTSVAAHNQGLVIRQYYSLVSDASHGNRIFAGSQDNGTDRRPDSGGTEWDSVTGGDGYEPNIAANVPSILYVSVSGQLLRLKDAGSKAPVRTIVTPNYPPAEYPWLFAELAVDPQKPSTLYTGTSRVWRTTNGAETWDPLPTRTTDGSTWSAQAEIRAIAVAPSDGSILMVAIKELSTFTPSIFRSTDGGMTWVDATSNLRITPRWINNVVIDPRDPKIAYAALAGSRANRLWKTTDGGLSWQPRAEGLPPFSAQVVRVDPTDSNVLYCGTLVGIFRSIDGGATWSRFGTGLPNAWVDDVISPTSSLRVATYGRGVWELDVPLSNRPPNVDIAPASPPVISRGSAIAFESSMSDPDDGDTVTGTWTFPDDWQTVPITPGRSVTHTFYRSGIYPVTLTATDNHGSVLHRLREHAVA